MAKPLLTDEVIEQARRDKERLEQQLRQEMENDPELAAKYDKIEQDLSKKSVYKSRRIEQAKQRKRGKTINKWLWIVVLIVVILAALFFWYYF